MRTLLIIGLLGLLLASPLRVLGDQDSFIQSRWRYVPIGRSAPMTVAAPDGVGQIDLALMTHDGTTLARVTVAPGDVDLGDVMPDVWTLERAAYLQPVVGGRPFGSALVVQPMLSRLIPVVEDTTNPSGVRSTRVVGWRDETVAFAPDDESDRASDDDAEEPPPSPIAPEPAPRLCTGLRVYVERDVLMRTDHGELRIALRPDEAPNTAWNFRELCAGGFYRDVRFHRVVPFTADGDPFVVQAGDPSATGSGGPGYWLPLERSALPHDFGVMSMARDVDPDSAGSQFFIALSRAGTARLDSSYCAFGQITTGADVIRSLAEVELIDVAAGRPADPPRIIEAVLMAAPPRTPGRGRPDAPVEDPGLRRQPPRVPR